MDIKITKRLISIPPYISTAWDRVQAISMENQKLQIILTDGSVIEIPDLEQETITQVFKMHVKVLEDEPGKTFSPEPFAHGGDQFFQFGFSAIDELGTVMQHNPQHANAPDLPSYVIEKIGALAKAMAPEDVQALPEAEANCNCMHCQIARAIISELEPQPAQREEVEDEVSDEELSFQQWSIQEVGEKMYTVTNKLDSNEHYNVFLGEPVGCTCGQMRCEHIVAVLKS